MVLQFVKQQKQHLVAEDEEDVPWQETADASYDKATVLPVVRVLLAAWAAVVAAATLAAVAGETGRDAQQVAR